MKKAEKYLILLILATLIVLFFVLKDDFNGIVSILTKIKLSYLFVAFIVLLIADLFKGYALYMVTKEFKQEYRFIDAYKLNLISNFFNGITPFSSGGQPYQVYYLKKNHDVDYSKGTSIVFQNFLTQQIAIVVLTTIAVILNEIFKFIPIDPFLKQISFLGYIVNFVIMVVLLIINYDRNGNHFLVRKLMVLLNKVKLLNRTTLDRTNEYLDGFYKSVKHLRERKYLLLKGIIFNIITLIGTFGLTLIVFYSAGLSQHLSFITILIAMNYITLVCSFVPIPGGTIGYEVGFITFFGFLLKGPILKAGMLLSRFVTYYFITILGGIIFLLDRNRRKE